MQPLQNKSGGTIFANTNAIVQQSAGTEDAENTTITNAGTIYSVNDERFISTMVQQMQPLQIKKVELFIIQLPMLQYKSIQVRLYLIIAEQLITEIVHQILE